MSFDDNTKSRPPAGKRTSFRFIHYLSESDHISQPPLQNYDQYHARYLQLGCQKQHNTEFFDKCCHPLLVGFRVAILGPNSRTTQKGEPMSVLDNLGCKAPDDECDDGDSPVPPSSTLSSPSQPAHVDTPPSAPPSPSSKPASAALAKGNESPPSSTSPAPVIPTSTPPKTSTSPPPAKTSGGGGEVHTGQYVS